MQLTDAHLDFLGVAGEAGNFQEKLMPSVGPACPD